jgi:hypothetical protein
MTESIIVCAANRAFLEDGTEVLLIGARHWDKHMHRQANVYGDLMCDKHNPDYQGFVDQYGQWFSRVDAMAIAKENGQIRNPEVGGGEHEKELFSEHLY